MTVYQVGVEWASARPPVEANCHRSLVVVEADSDTDAQLIAAQMVACRPSCVMPTATVVLGLQEGQQR